MIYLIHHKSKKEKLDGVIIATTDYEQFANVWNFLVPNALRAGVSFTAETWEDGKRKTQEVKEK